MPRRHALHNYCPADGPTDRFLIAFPFALPSRRFRSLLEKASCTPPTTASSCLSDDSAPPPAWLPAPSEVHGLFVERKACSHLRAAAHTSLGHAGLPFDGFSCHPGTTRTLRMLERFADWYEHLHPVVAPQLSGVSIMHEQPRS